MSDASTLRLRQDEPVAEPPAYARPAVPHRIGPVNRLLRETGYAISSFALGWFFFVLALTGLALTAGLAVLLGGVLLLPVTLYAARGYAIVERLHLRDLLLRPTRMPAYLRARGDEGFWRRATLPVRDPQSWLDLVWALLSPITATVAFVAATVWWAGTLGGLSYWFWQRYIPRSPDETGLAHYLGFGDGRTAESWTELGVGVVMLVTLPLVLRGVTALHAGLAAALLCSRAELQHRVERVEISRDAARVAEATSLRRLERDIHDGPQQRLVRLSMDLGRARKVLESEPDRAAELIEGALSQARETVAELRSLSRGVAPPLLVDRGLAVALQEMLTHAAVPVEPRLDVPDGLAPHVETAVYFVVAESLTNIAKHSGATAATVAVAPVGDALEVTVSDNGTGGALEAKGHGLAGLRQRLLAVDGVLAISSPAGGPTTLSARIPLGRDGGRR